MLLREGLDESRRLGISNYCRPPPAEEVGSGWEEKGEEIEEEEEAEEEEAEEEEEGKEEGDEEVEE